MRIVSLDHLVLTVTDVAQTIRWYETVLGLTAKTFGSGRQALHFGQQKINLHQVDSRIEPHAPAAAPGIVDICLVAGDCTGDELADKIRRAGADIELGPVPRTGALGPITSVYLRDPDQNLIEVCVYGEPSGG